MATLMVIECLLVPSLQRRGGVAVYSAGRGERRKVAPHVAGFDQVHAVPLERLLDDELRPEGLVEAAGRLVAGDDPHDQRGRAVPALRVDHGGDEAMPDAGVL